MTIASVIDTSVNSSAEPKKKIESKKRKEGVNLTLNSVRKSVCVCVWERLPRIFCCQHYRL